jgi:hypothetical protein
LRVGQLRGSGQDIHEIISEELDLLVVVGKVKILDGKRW